MPPQRIISLLPSATEILVAVGAGPDIVGTTHECPSLPGSPLACTANLLAPGLSAAEIDAAVAAGLSADPHTIYRLETDTVRALAPTVIVTQSLCAVCAVPEPAVRALACTLPRLCRVVSADPHTLQELFGSIAAIAAAVGRAPQAAALEASLAKRLAAVRAATARRKPPRVLVLEWPDPPYAPGHWVPDMVEHAGGVCVLGKSGEKSARVTWEAVLATRPDVVVNAYCGYELAENEREVDKIRDTPQWAALAEHAAVFATNASAFFSRPGPRLVDGTELLACMLYGIADFCPPPNCASVLQRGKWVDLADLHGQRRQAQDAAVAPNGGAVGVRSAE